MTVLYWDYDAIASVYKGFNLTELTQMSVRKRSYWVSMAKWRMRHT